jgi:hypothetical protein
MNNTKQAGALPDPNAAYNHLFDNVHAQVFFGRLASRGYVPQSEKQANDYLQIAGRLRHVEATEKAAGDQHDPIGLALAALDATLGETGMDGHLKAAQARDADMAIKEAAAELAGDPLIYNSVLSLAQAEAQAAAQQLRR